MDRYFLKNVLTDRISEWKSKELSEKSINPYTTSNNSLAPALSYFDNKVRVKFDGSFSKQDQITFTHEKPVNIYIFYEKKLWNYSGSSDPILGHSLFDAA